MTAAAVEGTGDLATALRALLAGVDGADGGALPALILPALILIPSGDITAVLDRVRTMPSPATVIVVDGAATPPFDAHLLLAAIEPLAIEAAPLRRISAVHALPNADPADVAAATAFLLRAISVTGQIIRIDTRITDPRITDAVEHG